MKHRKIFSELQEHLSSKRHTILVGPRQTGKTTLLKQLRDYCKEQGWPTVYLDLEHKDIREELDKTPGNVFLYAPLTQERVYFFIDEIQKLYTCDFEEYLLLGGKEEMLEEVRRLRAVPDAKSAVLPLLQREFYEYIRFGGYPEVVTETDEEEKIDILKDLQAVRAYSELAPIRWYSC